MKNHFGFTQEFNMNPLTNVKNITKLNEIELSKGTKKSWHDLYKDSAWIFIGGLAYGLTEGDILAVFSQYGEIVNINMVRDKKTGKTKGFCFLCYANQKSTVLAVDNFNGIKLCSRTIRVDHVANYKPPKEDDRDDDLTKVLKSEGCAPKLLQPDEKSADNLKTAKKKKLKKEKKEKRKRKHNSDGSDVEDTRTKKPTNKHETHDLEIKQEHDCEIKQVKCDPEINQKKLDRVLKKEKYDPAYDKYDTSAKTKSSGKRHFQESTRKFHQSEASSYQQKHRSDNDRQPHMDKHQTKENVMHHSRSTERGKIQDQSRSIERYSDHYQNNKDMQNIDKRRRSTSTDSSSSSSTDSNKHKNSKAKSRNYKPSSGSSDDERNRIKKKGTKREKYRTYDEDYSRSRNKDKHDQWNYAVDSSSSKRKDYDERYSSSDRSSKNKYRN